MIFELLRSGLLNMCRAINDVAATKTMNSLNRLKWLKWKTNSLSINSIKIFSFFFIFPDSFLLVPNLLTLIGWTGGSRVVLNVNGRFHLIWLLDEWMNQWLLPLFYHLNDVITHSSWWNTNGRHKIVDNPIVNVCRECVDPCPKWCDELGNKKQPFQFCIKIWLKCISLLFLFVSFIIVLFYIYFVSSLTQSHVLFLFQYPLLEYWFSFVSAGFCPLNFLNTSFFFDNQVGTFFDSIDMTYLGLSQRKEVREKRLWICIFVFRYRMMNRKKKNQGEESI